MVFMVCDCIHNFFASHGFRTTVAIALDLYEDLSKKTEHLPALPAPPAAPKIRRQATIHNPTSSSIPKAIPKESPKETPSQTFVSERRRQWELRDRNLLTPPHPLLARTVTKNISPANARKIYIENPSNCSEEYKISLFKLIKNVTDVFDLIQKITKSDKLDLCHPNCVQVIEDVLERGAFQLVGDLINALEGNKTLNLSALKKLLSAIIRRELNSGINLELLYPLETLIKMVDELYLSINEEAIPSKELPVNDPAVVDAFCILLERKHDSDDKIQIYLSRMIEKPEFDIDTFIRFIDVYIKKEKESHNTNIVNPARDRLVHAFNTKPALQQTLKNHARYEEIHVFMIRHQ